MKIYIPSHLRELELVDRLCKMIEVYSTGYYEDYNTSFSDFYEFYLKSDPVRKFLSMMIEKKEGQSEEEYEDQINYISSLFYNVKGTPKVLDYIIKYLGNVINFDSSTPITYNGTYLTLVIDSISIRDENLFFDSFLNFLDALLYFDRDNSMIKIKSASLIINSELKNYVDVNLINYVEYDI